MRKLAAVTLAMWTLVATAIEPPETPPGPQQQEPAPAPAPAEPAAEPAEDAAASSEPAPDTDAAAAGDSEQLPPLPPEAETAGPSPERFNPTEKVRADFPVSFPIDI